MLSPDELLDIIATEAIEEGSDTSLTPSPHELPPIIFPLQLIRLEDGTLEWVE